MTHYQTLLCMKKRGMGLRDHDREFGKHRKIIAVERVDSMHAISLHRSDDL
jgi:hypothetical protein